MEQQRWDESEWLARFRSAEGQESAFRELMRHFHSRLYGQVRRMVSSHGDCDDVLQEVWVKAWVHLPAFREESKISTWLFRIAYNESLNFLNRRKRLVFPEEGLPESASSPGFTAAEGDLLAQKLQEAIAQLPPRQQAVFCYRYFDELPYEEIAAILQVSTGSLKASYFHAAQKVEDYILNH